MSKKKKSKKRKTSIIKDVDSDSPVEKEPKNETFRPTKKQKLTVASPPAEDDGSTNEKRRDPSEVTSESKQKKLKLEKKDKKKKKKKKSKHKSKSTADLDEASATDSVNNNGGNSSQVSLEGMMVDNQMVLVDRSNSRVYSMNDRDDNGEHIQIGSVGKDGKVILDSSKHKKEDSSSGKMIC